MQYKGLTTTEVEQNRQVYGSNLITQHKKRSAFKLFLEKFNDPLIKILLIAALISFGIGFVNDQFIEAIGILFAIFLATGIGFWFEYDANKKFDILNLVNNDTLVKVIRDGFVTEVRKGDIVVGDYVILSVGDEVPADGILIESVSLLVDESSLTGEPSTRKGVDLNEFKKESTFPYNKVLRSSKILDGSGIFVVDAVGDSTEYGKVAKSSVEISNVKTPLNIQLEKLAGFIGVVGTSVAILTFFALLIKDLMLKKISLTFEQSYFFISIIIFFAILSLKLWFPYFSSFKEMLFKKKSVFLEKVEKIKTIKLFVIALLVLILSVLVSLIFDFHVLEKSAWMDIPTASRILQYFMVAVTLVVVTVPEGLPMSVTLCLALSMRNMLKSNNLVRKMQATETMGACTVICTDKTGTLTKNQMEVVEAMFFGREVLDFNGGDDNLIFIKENISANSTADLDYSDETKIKGVGNPTESALLLWLHKMHCPYEKVRNATEVLEQLSFSTDRKYMASVVFSPILNKKVLYVKGASEILFHMSKQVYCEDGVKPNSECSDLIKTILAKNHSQALRTLGFAYEILEDDTPRIEDAKLVNHNLTFYGFVGIQDPIRDDVNEAVATCLKAGIDIIIVTGDTYGIAVEIAKKIGLLNADYDEKAVLTGDEFSSLTDEELLLRLKDLKILCRARPLDKKRLVQLLQELGEVVAVTGDGTNDAPALNFAHVGLSMGSGTAVAKEASDITIMDDSFDSIGSAVLWGRTLYQNIQRFVVFQLSINLVAMLIVFIGSIVGHEIPLTITQMLWINLIMDTFAAGAFASLPPNKSVMNNKPRKSNEFIINKTMRNSIFITGLSFVVILLALLYYFTDEDGNISIYNLSLFFTTFVMLQFWNMFNVKALFTGKSALKSLHKSKAFLTVALAILVGQIFIVQFGGEMFRTVPISFVDWLIIFGATSLVLWIGEIKRLIFG
ncbi:MAG: calcium-translocating P-type ATPase, PMCA-type [Bacteroidota bacterium]|jgi:Ca2+-transporting ATPase|nr:calcium-translocating P-type ATPase, PMCA-type [Bacteroidota bacterium]NLP20003.1 calcium-translocating P-type ATPase, PMCA-type [Bacteroidales bacterium]OQC46199.1 MAG: Calcium-transporting ATPase [Bacteroidetes bacterium ADurb.Bin028]HNY44120.1 calcium-translocating P-type ATPase, PMCA-type [Bacteroidales bacterium]HOD87448.1 calcium-translocating P-type ATPase, PMCA-type [Bacteroidales bacterium]